MSDLYSIPKRRVQVQIRMPQLGAQSGFLFLSDRAEGRLGPECPSDIFNSTRPFVVVENARGGVSFVHCEAISTVTVDAEEELGKDLAVAEALAQLDTEERIAVTLCDGSVLEGTARYQLPEANSRVQDYLNLPERFMRLHVNDKVILVSKRHIARVTPL